MIGAIIYPTGADAEYKSFTGSDLNQAPDDSLISPANPYFEKPVDSVPFDDKIEPIQVLPDPLTNTIFYDKPINPPAAQPEPPALMPKKPNWQLILIAAAALYFLTRK